MKKQIDGWAFLGDDGEWKMFHPDFGKVQYQMLEGKLGAGKIVEVRLLDASDDSKDVVVPRELLEWVNNPTSGKCSIKCSKGSLVLVK